MRRPKAWWGVALGLVVLAGLGLRGANLGRHYFWYDEALILDPGALGKPALEYARRVWRETTYNPGWPFVVWGFLHTFGNNLTVARVPSRLVGTLAIVAIYRAARALRLDRPTALLAALFTALSWTQIQYSQQVLPYAAAPWLSAVCLGLLARIDRLRPEHSSRRMIGAHLSLVAVCAVYVAIHNAFLLMLPVIGLSLCLSLVRPARIARGFFNRRAVLGLVTIALILGPAVFFYLPKRGGGFRTYLAPFYLTTFRDPANRHAFRPPYLVQLDEWYATRVAPKPSPVRDVPYFVATRTLDWLTLNLNPRYSIRLTESWAVCALPTLGLCAWGTITLLRGRVGRAPALLAVSGLSGVGLAVVMSLGKMYPYGGVRQMLPLAPFVMIAAAVGARRVFATFPRSAGMLTAGVVVVTLATTATYFANTRTLIDKSRFEQVLRQTAIKTVVAGDTEWSADVLKYLGRSCKDLAVVEPTAPEFPALLRSGQPFLVISLGWPPFQWTPDHVWTAEPRFRARGLILENYQVDVLQCGLTEDVVQQSMIYTLRPLPILATGADPARR